MQINLGGFDLDLEVNDEILNIKVKINGEYIQRGTMRVGELEPISQPVFVQPN